MNHELSKQKEQNSQQVLQIQSKNQQIIDLEAHIEKLKLESIERKKEFELKLKQAEKDSEKRVRDELQINVSKMKELMKEMESSKDKEILIL